MATISLMLVGQVVFSTPSYAASDLYVRTDGTNAGNNNCQSSTNPCATISYAVSQASSGDTIVVDLGTYADNVTIRNTLTNLTITGVAGLGATIKGLGSGPIFEVAAGASVSLDWLSISHTFLECTELCGPWPGVTVDGQATLSSDYVSDNGGIEVDSGGGATVENSSLSNNPGSAGLDVLTGGTAALANDSVANDFTGISNSGTLKVSDSTLSGNANSGLINTHESTNPDPTATLTDDTLALNTSDTTDSGGGIYNDGNLTLVADTLAENSASSGAELYADDGIANVAGTIFGENSASGQSDCAGSGTLNSGSYDIDADATCDLLGGLGNQFDTDPELGQLGDNGGNSETMVPGAGSRALGKIPKPFHAFAQTLCPSTDQRGVARPQMAKCDIGSVELQPTPVLPTSGNIRTTLCSACHLPFIFNVSFDGTSTSPSNRDLHTVTSGKIRLPGSSSGTCTEIESPFAITLTTDFDNASGKPVVSPSVQAATAELKTLGSGDLGLSVTGPVTGGFPAPSTSGMIDLGISASQFNADCAADTTPKVHVLGGSVDPAPPSNTELPPPTSWFSHSLEPGTAFQSVSCSPSSAFCAAVDAAGNAWTSSDNGSSWTQWVIPQGGRLTGVSCDSQDFCMAVDYEGNAFSFNGNSWTSLGNIEQNSGRALDAVTCFSGTWCMATDNNGDYLIWDPSVYTTNNGWSSASPVDSSNPVGLVDSSCASPTFCVAVGGSEAETWRGGTPWGAPQPIDTNGDLSSVSCASSTFCAAVDLEGYGVTTTDGISWGSLTPIDGQLRSVSCAPSSTVCAAASANGSSAGTVYLFTESSPQGTAPVPDVDSNGVPAALSCPTTTFCALVDDNGNALVGTG